MEPTSPAKKKKKAEKSRKSELIQIRIDVAKPGSKKYTHLDWNELLRQNGHQRDEEELSRFYDEDTLFMAKKLGETKSKNGKKIRVNLDQIQHWNRACGYDMDDDFIDDTEAVEDTNFVSKKGGFYIGKGEVKAQDESDDEEDSEEEEEEVVQEVVAKQRKKKMKEKGGEKSEKFEKTDKSDKQSIEKGEKSSSATVSSSDSEPDVVRMTGAPPRGRMSGAPPSKRARAIPPPGKEPTPPPGLKTFDLFKKNPAGGPPGIDSATSSTSSTSASSSDIICLDDSEPPLKKKAPEPEMAGVSSAPPVISPEVVTIKTSSTTTTKGSTVTQLAKKICKQQEEINKLKSTPPKLEPYTPTKQQALPSSSPSTSSSAAATSSSSTPPANRNLTAIVTHIYETLSKKGRIFKEKKEKQLDVETLNEISKFLDVMQHHKAEKVNFEPIFSTLAASFGLTKEEVMRQVEMAKGGPSKGAETIKKEKPEEIDWKFTKADLPSMSTEDIQRLTTIVASWKSKKQMTNDQVMKWLKEVNEERMNIDGARVKFFKIINSLPDVEKPSYQDNGLEMPKHERSRKPRMFLHQWVYLSRKYVELLLPTLTKPIPPTAGLAKKQLEATNALKEAMKKQINLFESRKDRRPEDAVYTFQFTEPVLASIAPYLEELCDYCLSCGKLDVLVTAIDTLHQPLDGKITLIQFYIELCRRLQKLSFLIVEEPMKSRLAEANEQIVKHQVVQNPKYQIKWPGGEEPSLRGLNSELHNYDKSVLQKVPRGTTASPSIVKSTSTPNRPSISSKPAPSAMKLQSTLGPSTSSTPATSSSSSIPKPSSATSATSDDVAKQRQQAMNQLVQSERKRQFDMIKQAKKMGNEMIGRPPV